MKKHQGIRYRILLLMLLLLPAVAGGTVPDTVDKAKGYYFTGKYEIALVTLLRAVQQAPDRSDLYLYIGNIYTHKKRFQQALQFYRIGLDLTRSPGIFLFNMGQANYYSKQYRAALSCFTQAAVKSNVPPEVHLEMGRTYFQLSDRTNTVRSWKRYLDRAPRNPQADTLRKAIALLEGGKVMMPADRAKLEQQQAAARKKKQDELRRKLQQIMQNNGQSGTAGQTASASTNTKPLVDGQKLKAKVKDEDTKSKGRENYDGKEGLEN